MVEEERLIGGRARKEAQETVPSHQGVTTFSVYSWRGRDDKWTLHDGVVISLRTAGRRQKRRIRHRRQKVSAAESSDLAAVRAGNKDGGQKAGERHEAVGHTGRACGGVGDGGLFLVFVYPSGVALLSGRRNTSVAPSLTLYLFCSPPPSRRKTIAHRVWLGL